MKITKKRIEEIRNSHIGEDVDIDFDECIRKGEEMSRENQKLFSKMLGV